MSLRKALKKVWLKKQVNSKSIMVYSDKILRSYLKVLSLLYHSFQTIMLFLYLFLKIKNLSLRAVFIDLPVVMNPNTNL